MKSKVLIALMCLAPWVQAQTVDHIIDMTGPQIHGSARYSALGGAFTALGNDMAAIHYNPASIGVFRRDHFGLSLGFQNANTAARYGNNTIDDNAYDFLFENIGLVKKLPRRSRSKSTFAFGLSYTKKADFYEELSARTTNTQGESFADFLASNSFGKTPDQLLQEGLFEEYAAFGAFLTDYSDSVSQVIDRQYFVNDGSIEQEYVISKSGRINEFALSFGGDYDNFIQWGVSLNIPSIRTTKSSIFSEVGFADNPTLLNNHQMERFETFSATGFNANFGFILRPSQWLRLAASYQTPTIYRFNSQFDVTSITNFNDGTSENWTVVSDNTGSLTIPGVFRTGAAFVLGKRGLFSLDYETSGIQNSSLAGLDYAFDQEQINNQLQRINTLRAGLEIRFDRLFLRGGYMNSSNPFVEDSFYQQSMNAYTGGIGLRNKYYTIDLAYVRSVLDRNLPTYSTDANALDALTAGNNLILSFGLMF